MRKFLTRQATITFKNIFKTRDIPLYAKKLSDIFLYKRKNIAPPLRIQIELASMCNLKCSFCILSKMDRKKRYMSFSHYIKIIDECGAPYVQLSGVGETFYHSKIIDIIKYAKDKSKFVKITTNGHLINKK